MRNMSFALTKPQMLARTKLVTRRVGWQFLRVGDLLQPVEKCMGLKPGEKIVKIGPPIRVVRTDRQPLEWLRHYGDDGGLEEVRLEGFAGHPEHGTPGGFIAMFCASHRGCTPQTVITRIAFEFTETPDA